MKLFLALFLTAIVACASATNFTIDGETYDLSEIEIELNLFDKLHEIEEKLKGFIAKYGPKALNFIKCMVS